jgi:hypothetical protein
MQSSVDAGRISRHDSGELEAASSVMHSNPRFPHLTESDLGQLRYLLTTQP